MNNSDIPYLIDAAKKIGAETIIEDLQQIQQRSENHDAPVMIPLVGEFSSGKTTLINALTDSHALETATKPTTATIYEIHFGANTNCAQVLYEDGHHEDISDISLLCNDRLSDAKVVTVFDKSTLVSPTTILVDTPGLSSPDPKHKQTLVDFLPQADGILLVIDINQQLTRSLTEFIKTMRLANHAIYAVLTKTDTKSPQEVDAAKKYFSDNSEIPVNNIAAVSATTNDLGGLIEIFKDIEARKAEIISGSDNQRLKVIAKKLLSDIETFLSASSDNNELEKQIREQQHVLDKIKRQIDRLINRVDAEIDDLSRNISRKFEDQVTEKLTALVNGSSQNYDAEACSAINSYSSLLTSEFRQGILQIVAEEEKKPTRDGEVSLSGLTGIDLSSVGITGLSYDLDLNSMGHQYDKWIKGGVIAVAAVGAVSAVSAIGAATAGRAAAGAVSTGQVVTEGALLSKAIDVADTVSDVGSIISNRNMSKRMEQAVKYGQQVTSKYAEIDQFNERGMSGSGTGQGILDSITNFIAEKTMSKPQRKRAIRQFIDDRLSPEFKTALSRAKIVVISAIRDGFNEAAQASVNEITQTLKSLQSEMQSQKAAAEERLNDLRSIRTNLLTL